MTESEQEPAAIEVIYTEQLEIEGQKGLFGDGVRRVTRVGSLDTDALASGLGTVCNRLATAFEGVTEAVRNYELGGFDVQLEVTAKGEVRLIGSASTEIKGGVTLHFRRRDTTRS